MEESSLAQPVNLRCVFSAVPIFHGYGRMLAEATGRLFEVFVKEQAVYS